MPFRQQMFYNSQNFIIGGIMEQKQSEKNKFVNQFMADKAGMADIDKTKINQIIQKMTEGTPKSLYQKQQRQKRQLQLAEMLGRTLSFSIAQKKQMKDSWDVDIKKLQSKRNLQTYWAHLDFDMFYIACQILDRPELKELPCAVGGQNSVLCTANYAARKFGVRSALPTFIAMNLCPNLILVHPNFQKYKKYSNIFRDILRKYDPQLQSHGLDEAYIQITKYMKQKNPQQKQDFITAIRNQIFLQTGLTVSCGVGANKLLAKLASQQNKPNGQFLLPNQGDIIQEFMKPKKIRKIQGIGPVNEFFLKGLGIQTASDILSNTDTLSICFSTGATSFYISSALGLGSVEHQFVQRKSLGKSETFKSTSDKNFLESKIISICQQVCMELEQIGYISKNIVLIYQTQSFSKKDKTFQLNRYTSNKDQLVEKVLPFLQEIIQTKKQKLRLLGARCTNILKIEDLRKIQLDKYLKNPQQLQNSTSPRQKIGNFVCPICDDIVDCQGNLARFNRHFDQCMKGQQTKFQFKSTQQIAEKFIEKERSLKNDRNIVINQKLGKLMNKTLEKPMNKTILDTKKQTNNKHKNTNKTGTLLNYFKSNQQ